MADTPKSTASPFPAGRDDEDFIEPEDRDAWVDDLEDEDPRDVFEGRTDYYGSL